MEISSGLRLVRCLDNPHFHPSSIQFPLSFSSNPLKPLGSFPQRPPICTHPFSGASLLATRSLPDDVATVGLTMEPAEADPFLAVKKHAIDLPHDLKGTSIFLVGMSNPMKAKIGKVIADALRYYYFDSDSLVEEAAGDDPSGKSCKERDETGFRESETEVLRQLSSMGRLIVNAGDGAVQNSTNLAFLRHGICIWVDIPLDTIAKNNIDVGNQRSLSSDSFAKELDHLTAVYHENKDGYAIADARVSLLSNVSRFFLEPSSEVATNLGYDEYDQVRVEDMAIEVLKELEKLTRVKKMMEEAGRPF